MNEIPLDALIIGGTTPIVKTIDIQRGLDGFSSWLIPENRQPFLLVGPPGCGKRWHILMEEYFLLEKCLFRLHYLHVCLIHYLV